MSQNIYRGKLDGIMGLGFAKYVKVTATLVSELISSVSQRQAKKQLHEGF